MRVGRIHIDGVQTHLLVAFLHHHEFAKIQKEEIISQEQMQTQETFFFLTLTRCVRLFVRLYVLVLGGDLTSIQWSAKIWF